MSEKLFQDGVEWNPEMDAKSQAAAERHKLRFTQPATAFRDMRTALGLTQVEAARRLGTTQANVSKLESKPMVDVVQLKKLVADDDFEVSVVISGKGQQFKFMV